MLFQKLFTIFPPSSRLVSSNFLISFRKPFSSSSDGFSVGGTSIDAGSEPPTFVLLKVTEIGMSPNGHGVVVFGVGFTVVVEGLERF